MIARPVAEFLVQMELGASEPAALFIPTDADLTPAWSEEVKDDPQAQIDAARDEGYAAGVEAATAEHAAQLALAREQFAAELANSLRQLCLRWKKHSPMLLAASCNLLSLQRCGSG
jgi:hypothetical protein